MEKEKKKNTKIKKRSNGKETGRRLALDSDPRKIDLFVRYIASGMPVVRACEYSQLGQSTYYNYMNLADEDEAKGLTEEESVFLAFRKRINDAQGELYEKLLKRMEHFSNIDWRAADALLNKIDPEHFGKKEINNNNMQIVVKNDIPNE